LDMWRYSQHLFASLAELALLRGEPGDALRYAQECYDLAAPANHRKNVVKAKRLRGEAFLNLRRLEDAEVELDGALEIARTLGNPPQLWKTLEARGRLEKARCRPSEAVPYLAEAIELRRATIARRGDHPLVRELSI